MTFPAYLARQKLRFDLGQSFLAILQLGFIVIAASDKLATIINIPARWLVTGLVPASMLLVWAAGYILDRMRFYEAYQAEVNRRNEMLSAVHSATKGDK